MKSLGDAVDATAKEIKAFFGGKLAGSLDAYNSDTYDLLLDRSISPAFTFQGLAPIVSKKQFCLSASPTMTRVFVWTINR